MLEHEFYADPTVFDQWHNNTGNWFGSGLEKLSPFSWALCFCGLAAAFLLVAIGVFLVSLQHSGLDETTALWNQALAQGVTVIIALTASASLFKEAIKAWPRTIANSDGFRTFAVFAVWRKSQQAQLTGISHDPAKSPLNIAADRQAVQEFFAGVRAAGVNVAIAKALFAAGVRSAQVLNGAEDCYLYGIHGVGPATVRKLRAHFSQH
jgi:hypothetical protein